MLHRAILGSIERFLGILIEQHAGALPAWLAPQQVMVATIVSDANDYANEVVAALRSAGMRADLDLRNEKIGYKVREHSLQKIPAILCIGKILLNNLVSKYKRNKPTKHLLFQMEKNNDDYK